MRAERSLPAGLGLPPASRENGLALWEQTEDSVGGRRLPPDQQQHHSSGTQPGWKHARLPWLGARSPKRGPAGAGQKGGGRKGQHRRALSSIGDPPGTMGVQGARATRPPPCLSANELLQEGLQLVLVLDAHELVHHVPVLDGQHGGHS